MQRTADRPAVHTAACCEFAMGLARGSGLFVDLLIWRAFRCATPKRGGMEATILLSAAFSCHTGMTSVLGVWLGSWRRSWRYTGRMPVPHKQATTSSRAATPEKAHFESRGGFAKSVCRHGRHYNEKYKSAAISTTQSSETKTLSNNQDNGVLMRKG